MPLHQPYPVILERAVIARGVLLHERQDELIGFAWSETEVANLFSLQTSEAVGLVRQAPNAFISDLSEDLQSQARSASQHWFVSRADEEIFVTFGQTDLKAVPQSKRSRKPKA